MMPKIVAGCFGILLILAICGPAKAGRLRIAYDSFPPMSFVENGQAKGVSIDIVREACSRLGYEAEFIHMPFARLLESARLGQVDAVVNLYRTDSRESFLCYPEQGKDVVEIFVYARSDYCGRIESLRDISTEKVGVVRGYYYGEGVIEALGENVEYVKDIQTLFKMLAEDRLQLIVCSSMAAAHYMDEFDFRAVVTPVLEVERLDCYFVVFPMSLGQRSPRLADLFSEEICRIREEWQEQRLLD